ncbi:MAG: tyrosine--tRNA ligase [Candidatus Gastranaerophilales bacterium]|nr:tyrosine--tRNA ligase [Candidatus Gastranaerophilales bacterium]
MGKEKSIKIHDNFIHEAEYLSRGAEVLPGGVIELARKLKKSADTDKPLRVKLGLDPTRPDLHLGHSVVLRKLKHFQNAGHKIVLIIGGATAMIGDPSGKSETRPPLTREEVEENAKTYLDQVGKIIDVSKAEIVNNADWLHKMQLADLLQLASKVTVAQMLVRDDFSKRYNEGKPISVHELFYPLMQAYDSVAIDADIELGGTDQRFNTLLGREIQQAYGREDPQMVMLLPILEGTDGVVKMSKTYPEHCISMTDSPQEMYGKIMSIPDNLIIRYFELLTDLPQEEIDNHREQLKMSYVNPRDYKMKLAKTIITDYYPKEEAFRAEREFINIFRNKGVPEEMPEYPVAEGTCLVDFLAEKELTSSKGEARRLIQGGGIKIDSEKVTDTNLKIMFNGKESLVLQAGKRKFAKLIKL